MLAAERKQAILTALAEHGKVLAADLSSWFQVSEDTIRRDLRELAEEGLLHRVHGGALPKTPMLPRYTQRRAAEAPAKAAIGTVAASLLKPGQVIIIDGGTTPRQVAASLPPGFKATVVSHSIPALATLSEYPELDLVMVGGQVDKYSQVAVGAVTTEAYRQLHADVCVLGMAGIHPGVGLTDQIFEEANVKRFMIAAASQVIGVVTSEKIGTVSTYAFGAITALTHLVTDPLATEEQLAPYRAAGIQILQA